MACFDLLLMPLYLLCIRVAPAHVCDNLVHQYEVASSKGSMLLPLD